MKLTKLERAAIGITVLTLVVMGSYFWGTQRGAEPVAKDSAFAFEAGNLAVRLLRDGVSNQVIGVQQGRVFYMPIEEALRAHRDFRRDLYDLVNTL